MAIESANHDFYSTYYLNGLVSRMHPKPRFFLKRYFPEMSISEEERIYWDVDEEKNTLSVFTHPLHEGKLLVDRGYYTKSVKPAYIKEKSAITPINAIKKMAGEDFSGTRSMEERIRISVSLALQRHLNRIETRQEFMAVQTLLHGGLKVQGDGVGELLNFRSPGDGIGSTEAGQTGIIKAREWGKNDSDPGHDLEEWSLQIFRRSGAAVRDVVMDHGAFMRLRKSKKFLEILDKRRGDNTSVPIGPLRQEISGVTFRGYYGEFGIYVYAGYAESASGKTLPFMPTDTVLLLGDIQGVRHFGAIYDLANLRATPYFVKSKEEFDPSIRVILTQSAPMVVPYRIEACQAYYVGGRDKAPPMDWEPEEEKTKEDPPRRRGRGANTVDIPERGGES